MSKKFSTEPRAAKPATTKGKKVKNNVTEFSAPAPKILVDTLVPDAVPSDSHAPATTSSQEHTIMKLVKDTKERKGNNGKAAHYHIDGLRGSIKISSTIFGKDGAPAELTLDGDGFAVPGGAKVQETPEERKARLAAMPKLTPAEKLAKLEERVARAKAKLEAPAAQPAV